MTLIYPHAYETDCIAEVRGRGRFVAPLPLLGVCIYYPGDPEIESLLKSMRGVFRLGILAGQISNTMMIPTRIRERLLCCGAVDKLDLSMSAKCDVELSTPNPSIPGSKRLPQPRTSDLFIYFIITPYHTPTKCETSVSQSGFFVSPSPSRTSSGNSIIPDLGRLWRLRTGQPRERKIFFPNTS